MTLILDGPADLTLDHAHRVRRGEGLALGPTALEAIARGRTRFEAFLARSGGSFVYGTTTAPGARVTARLTPDHWERPQTLGEYAPLVPTFGRVAVPEATKRLAVLARLTNYLGGSGVVAPPTAQAVAALLDHPLPTVLLGGATGPGEVMVTLQLLGGLKNLPLGPGEPMALLNGAPWGAAFAVEGALGATALLERSTAVLALSAEAFAMPLEHYDPDLKDLWGDPFEGRALGDLGRWLAGAKRPEPRAHQAPVSWRIAPRVLGVAQRAAAVALEVAGSALVSRSDNPAFIQDPGDPSRDRCLATGGYHNGQAARVLDGLNAAYADVCVLAAKQTTKLLDGRLSQLPPLLVSPAAPVVGTEFCAWMPTDFAERARWAATPALLSLGCDDPQGGQSDVASPVFIAYERHGVAVESLAAALAVLAWVSSQALWLAERPVAPPLAPLLAEVRALAPPLTPANAGHLGAGLAALARYLQDGE